MFVKYSRLVTFFFGCYLLISCASINTATGNNYIVLKYEDFGPQDIAEELIGPDYWQWDNGHYDSPQKFDIKVVVYRNMSLDAVKAAFPVDKSKKQDYRYVEYQAAMKWYDKQIKSFNEDLDNKSGDINIAFFFLRNLYANALKIERALRK